MSKNYIAYLEYILNNIQDNDSCSKTIIHNDLCSMRNDVGKKSAQWLSKLVDAKLVFIEGHVIKVDI